MARRSFLRSLARRFGYDLRSRGDLVQQADPFEAQRHLLEGQDVAVVCDVGAHHGVTVAKYRAAFPEAVVHAFEPVAETFETLQAATQDDPRVAAHHVALGAAQGQATVHVNRDADTSSLLPFAAAAGNWMPSDVVKTTATRTVDVRTLSAHCKAHDIARIDVLKMDVQGYELEVLRGASDLLAAGAIELIFSEVEFVPVYEGQPLAHDITAFLGEFGYRLFRFYELVYSPSGQLLWGDAIYLSPARAEGVIDSDKRYRQAKTAP